VIYVCLVGVSEGCVLNRVTAVLHHTACMCHTRPGWCTEAGYVFNCFSAMLILMGLRIRSWSVAMLSHVFYFAAGDTVTTTYAVAAFLCVTAYML